MGKCGRKCVGAPHPNTLPYTSPIPLPTRQHFSLLTPYTLPHPSPHIFPYLPTYFPPPPPTPLPIAPLTSLHPNTLPHALFHTSPHRFHYVAKLPCDDVALVTFLLGPHTLIHFPTPTPFLSPHSFPTRQHTSPLTPFTLPHPSPHIFPCLPPHPNALPIPLPTAPLTFPYTPTHFPLTPCTLPHFYPHLPPQFRLCGEVTTWRCYLHKFNWQIPINFFTTTGNLKSFLGASSVNFRWLKVWRSYCGEVTMWRSYWQTTYSTTQLASFT